MKPAQLEQLKGVLTPFSLVNGEAYHLEKFEGFPQYFGHYDFYRLDRLYEQYFLGTVNARVCKIATHYWSAKHSKGTVLVVHGLFDHTGIYLPLVQRLLNAHYNVVSIDLPGHGLSEGKPAAIQHFNEYAEVLDAVIKHVMLQLPKPYGLVGQSTGGAAILNWLIDASEFNSQIEKTVLLAPLIYISKWWWVNTCYWWLNPWLSHFPRFFTANSHDEHFVEFLKCNDPLQARHISMDWLGALKLWIETFPSIATNTNIALHVIQGTNDKTVDWQKNVALLEAKFPRTSVYPIDGALHHLVNEAAPWQKPVFDRVVSILDGM